MRNANVFYRDRLAGVNSMKKCQPAFAASPNAWQNKYIIPHIDLNQMSSCKKVIIIFN